MKDSIPQPIVEKQLNRKVVKTKQKQGDAVKME